MYLGSEVTCPACQQKDATIQLSLLVNQAKKELTVHQVEALTRAVQRGEASKWERPPKDGSWEKLAKQLQSPAKPELSSIAKVVNGFVGWRYSPWVLALVFLSTFFAFYQYGLEVANLYVPAICLVWGMLLIFGIGTLVYIRDARQTISVRVGIWAEQMEKWNRLYFCGRDEQVFALGNPRHVAPSQIRELIAL